GADDLMQQLWFIRSSFATMRMAAGRRRQVTHQSVPKDTVIDGEHAPLKPNKTRPQELLAAARAVGDRLEKLAVRGKHEVTWIGLNYRNEGNAAVKPLDRDLYDGIPGVTLFLAHLGAMTGEDRFTSAAQLAVTNLRRAIESDRSRSQHSQPLIGAFCGWGGL